eukprot:m.282609 g.282609  ORF g.282609 m.282609 type:complete len:114 (-) comp145079_c0_seq1:191-532(-)
MHLKETTASEVHSNPREPQNKNQKQRRASICGFDRAPYAIYNPFPTQQEPYHTSSITRRKHRQQEHHLLFPLILAMPCFELHSMHLLVSEATSLQLVSSIIVDADNPERVGTG